MSEYQYYEFAAIDRPLTAAEMARLRQVSTRGRISASGFVNHYEWGGLKADPADWMRRYFDAFVYTANWCSCLLALRVPLATFRKAELKAFAVGHALTIEASGEHWIIDWSLDESEDYDRFAMEEGSGWMGRLAPLREELLRGDLRPLYLGWLASAGRLEDNAMEPEVPPGLAELSPPPRPFALEPKAGTTSFLDPTANIVDSPGGHADEQSNNLTGAGKRPAETWRHNVDFETGTRARTCGKRMNPVNGTAGATISVTTDGPGVAAPGVR